MPNPAMRNLRTQGTGFQPSDTDTDGNAQGPRRTVKAGTVDPFSVQGDPAPAAPPKAAAPGPTTADPAQDPSVFNVANTLKNRGKTIDKAVDDAS